MDSTSIAPPLADFVRRFNDFTRPYADNAGVDRATVNIKIDHTARVLDIASSIVEMEHFPEPVATTARLAALFHDTGRFPQFAKYGVFSDKASENHARLGMKTLLREHLLDGLPAAQRRIILGAVFLHNVRHLPTSLMAKPNSVLAQVTNVVRDADKLDIMPVMLAHLDGTRPMNKAVTLGIEPDPDKYSPTILEHFDKKEVGDYGSMRWQNDFKLLVLTWVYDFNFPASFRLLKSRGHLEAIMDSLPRTSVMDRVRRQVKEALAAKLRLPQSSTTDRE